MAEAFKSLREADLLPIHCSERGCKGLGFLILWDRYVDVAYPAVGCLYKEPAVLLFVIYQHMDLVFLVYGEDFQMD